MRLRCAHQAPRAAARRDPSIATPREQGHAGEQSPSGTGTMRVRAGLLAAVALLVTPTARADILLGGGGAADRPAQLVRRAVAAWHRARGRRPQRRGRP